MKIIEKLIVVVVITMCLYGIYITFQDNTNKYQNYEHTIDSLTTKIEILDSIKCEHDSTITIYKDSVLYVDSLKQIEKNKYTYIKNKYNEMHNHIIKYTNVQLDSFFTNRYRY